MPPTPYPPPFPAISGSTISVDAFLNNPVVVREVIRDLTSERFFMDRVFRPGPPGAAVIYNEVTATNLYADRDAEAIRPGAAFPKAGFTSPNPKTVAVEKYGLEMEITREDINRNNTDVLADAMTTIGNTVVKKVDTLAFAVLDANANKQTLTGVDFTSATTAQKIAVFSQARSLIEDIDMGYDGLEITAWFHPTQATEMLSDVDLLKLLQFEGPSMPARTGNIGLIMNTQTFKSNRVTAGTAWFVAVGVGSFMQEEGQGVLTNVYSVQESGPGDRRVQGWRPIVPYVRHPKAAVKVSSI